MRVALVHNQLSRGGGAERYLLDIIDGFRAAGDDVEVWARRIDHGVRAELGVVAHCVRTWPAPRLLRSLAMSSAVEHLCLTERYDLVLSLARTRGQHGWICGGAHPGYLATMGEKPDWYDRIETRLERGALTSSACGIAHSQLLSNQLQQFHGVDADHIRVIYPPVDVRRFHPVDAAARQQARAGFALKPGIRYFLFPSTGHFRKGFDLLVAAFSRLQHLPVRLLVAGNPVRQWVPDNIVSLGYVNDIAQLYLSADATVLPSRYEPFGLVLAESLQCGTPVITSPLCGIRELMQPADGLILEQLDADSMCRALLQFCDAPIAATGGFAEREGLLLERHIAALREIPRG